MRCIAAFGLVLAVAGAAADDGRAQIEQRIRLAARLIADAPAAQRIKASGNAQAVAHFAEGRVQQARAEDLLATGNLPAARRAVDEALRQLGVARRLVPDAPARLAAERQRHTHKLAQLDRLLEAWRVRGGPGAAADADLLAATGLIASARQLGQDGRHDDAGPVLDRAEHHVLAGMKRLLNSRTLDYTVRPANAAEEFQLELARHQGLADLVPLALNEMRPRPETAAVIERYQAASQTLLAQAVQQLEGGDATRALAHLRDAMHNLQRALSAAGVMTPAPTGSTP